MKSAYSDRNVIYLDCINVSILVVILCYNFTIIFYNYIYNYYLRQVDQRYTGFLCIISYNSFCFQIYNHFKIKNLIKI